MTRRTVGLLVLVALVGGVATVGAGVDTSYELSVDSGVDVEPRTVTLEGTSYTFSEIGKTTSTSEFDVTATVPSGSEYSIYVYNGDERIQDTKRMTGSGTATFDASTFEPGTYLLTIDGPDDGTRAVMPLVVTGYDADLSLPESATPGENVTIGISTVRTDSAAEATSRVSVVITHDGDEREVTAERVAEGEYEATVTLEETGKYLVYAGIHGQSEVDGEKQLVGLSEMSTIGVDDAGGGTSDGSGDSNDGTSGSNDGTSGSSDGTSDTDGDATETATVTEPSTATATGTETETASTTATDTGTETRTETATRSETEAPTASTATAKETASGPITPGDDTPEPEPVSMPLNGVEALLLLSVVASAVARVRSR